tara:strand:- start:103 stop:1320 length:1218 start_codon:yes stop_codon:yes gene_type:complete
MMTKSTKDEISNHIEDMYIEFEKNSKIVKKDYLNSVLDITKQYLIKENVVIYGGLAMNMYLDDKSKIYTDDDIPDFDGYISNAQKIALKFAKQLKQNGYNYVLLKKAIHDNTFKLSWEFNDIADFTDIQTNDYKLLVNKSTRIDNFLVAPIELVKANAYIELCMPLSSMFRWNKVYKRVVVLENNTKNSTTSKKQISFVSSNVPQLNSLVSQFMQLIIENNLPFIGIKAIRYFLGLDMWKHETIAKFAYISCMINNDSDFCSKIDELLTILRIPYTKKTKKETTFLFEKIIYYVTLNKKRYKLLSIQIVKSKCISTLPVKQNSSNISVISVFYLLNNLYTYQYLFSEKNTKYNREIQYIINKLKKQINNKQMYSEICLGTYVSKQSIIKNRLKNDDNPIIFSHIQ